MAEPEDLDDQLDDVGVRIARWQGIVIDKSLAESIVRAIDARPDLSEMHIATRLCEVWDRSFLEQRASNRPWVEEAQRIAEGGE